jgi:hypothetical protein
MKLDDAFSLDVGKSLYLRYSFDLIQKNWVTLLTKQRGRDVSLTQKRHLTSRSVGMSFSDDGNFALPG